MATPTKPKKFEEELKDLEEIVGKIDSGELTLEDSIGAFERGVALVRSLNQKLDEIEKKVEVLGRKKLLARKEKAWAKDLLEVAGLHS